MTVVETDCSNVPLFVSRCETGESGSSGTIAFEEHGGVGTGHSVYITVAEETVCVSVLASSLHGVYLNSRAN